MARGRVILKGELFEITIERICHQLIENYGDFSDACIVGIQPRGTRFAKRLYATLGQLLRDPLPPFGLLDITYYRDDFRTRQDPLRGNKTEIDFLVENRRVIMVDDVLYTGRTVQAALTAIQHYGRASQVELVALIDRRFDRHLPIQPNYTGLVVDALDEAYVKVEWVEEDGTDQIKLYPKTT